MLVRVQEYKLCQALEKEVASVEERFAMSVMLALREQITGMTEGRSERLCVDGLPCSGL